MWQDFSQGLYTDPFLSLVFEINVTEISSKYYFVLLWGGVDIVSDLNQEGYILDFFILCLVRIVVQKL